MVVLLEGLQLVRTHGLAMDHWMEEARWLIVHRNLGLLSFVRSVGGMGLRVGGLEEQGAAVVAVAGVVELADSDNGLAWGSEFLGRENVHGEREGLLEALLGMPSCALGEGSWEVVQRLEGQVEDALSLLGRKDSKDLTAEGVLESGSLLDDGCNRTQAEQVLGWQLMLDERPIVDQVGHSLALAGRLEDGCPVGLAPGFGLACRSPARFEATGGVP